LTHFETSYSTKKKRQWNLCICIERCTKIDGGSYERDGLGISNLDSIAITADSATYRFLSDGKLMKL
jgi:hypothetical protein